MAAIRRKLKGSDDGDRQMVQILSCVPDDGLQAVEAAGGYTAAVRSGLRDEQVRAARLARAMDRWTHLAEPYRSAAREAIARVAAKPDLSPGVREIVERALALG